MPECSQKNKTSYVASNNLWLLILVASKTQLNSVYYHVFVHDKDKYQYKYTSVVVFCNSDLLLRIIMIDILKSLETTVLCILTRRELEHPIPHSWCYTDHSLPKVGSFAHGVELVVVRAGLGLGVRRLGSEEPVPGALLGLLPLAVPESDQRVQLLPLLHLLLGGQRTRRARLKPD